MQLMGSVTAGMRRLVALCRLCLLASVVTMAGCVEVDSIRDEGQPAAQRELHRFRAKDLDYGNIVAEREDVQKYIAERGWGAVDREGDPLNGYLNSVLQRLVAVSPVPDVPARVVVLDLQLSPVAQATKDGTIYVPFKLLADMIASPNLATEDALAFLLAHELSHILHYHFRTDSVGDAVESVKAGTELIYGALTAFGEATGKASSMTSAMDKVRSFYGRVEVVQFLEESALTPAFTRGQENEADLLAFDLVTEAGYNPEAAYDFLGLLRAYEEAAEAHREAAQADAMQTQGDKTDLYAVLATGISTAITAGLTELRRNHATVMQRRADLGSYHDRWADEIADAEDVELRNLGWREGARTEGVDEADADTIRKLFANYEAARKAEAAIAVGDHDEAMVLVRQALSAPTEFNAYPRIVAALYHEERGDRAQAMENVRVALRGPGPSFPVYERFYRYVGNREERLAVLEEAERVFGRPVRLMRLRATTLDGLGRVDEARHARSLCFSENVLSKQRNKCNEPLDL